MITINIKNGRGSKPKDPYLGDSYDPSVGEVIKFITEDGNEYFVVTSPTSRAQGACHGCVFNPRIGHPLSKIFKCNCDFNVIRVKCYRRIYKPIDTILEELWSI